MSVTVTALLLMNVLQESKQVSFCVYVCACMCRNEAKVLMKAQGSSAVGFKIITSVHKGNSSLSVCMCVCFGCKGLRHSSVNQNLLFLPVYSFSFRIYVVSCSSFIYSSFHPPFLLIHSLSLSSPIQLILSRSSTPPPFSSSVFRSLHHSPLFILTDHLSFSISVCHSVFLCISLSFFSHIM